MNVDTVDLDAWLPLVRPDLPGCPTAMIRDGIWRAVDEFCRLSWYWKLDLDPIGTIAGERDYLVKDGMLPDDTKLVRVLYLTGLDSQGREVQIVPKTEDWLLGNVYDWKSQSSDDLAYFISPTKRTARLVPYPATSQPEILTFTVAVAPAVGVTQAGEVLWDDYREAIGCAARAIRMMDAGRRWSDPKRAQLLAQRGISDAENARQIVENGYNRPRLTSRLCYDVK